jgi:hypothetical protein
MLARTDAVRPSKLTQLGDPRAVSHVTLGTGGMQERPGFPLSCSGRQQSPTGIDTANHCLRRYTLASPNTE